MLADHMLADSANIMYGALGLDSLYGIALGPSGSDAYDVESACGFGDTACLRTGPALLLHYAVPGVLNPTGNFAVGRLLDVADLPGLARYVIVAPNGKTVALLGDSTVVLVDLTHTTPPSMARVRQTRALRPVVTARSPVSRATAPTPSGLSTTMPRPRIVRQLRR